MVVKLKAKRVMLYFMVVAMMPFLRACENVTYGFPAVVIEGKNLYVWDKIHIDNLIINLSVMFMLAKSFLVKYEKNDFASISTKGVRSVVVYHYFIFFGFVVIYHLFAITTIVPVPEMVIFNVQMLYVYFVYPIEPLIRHLLMIGSPDRNSEFNNIMMSDGLIKDISMRAAFIIMIFVWYFGGLFLEKRAIKKASL